MMFLVYETKFAVMKSIIDYWIYTFLQTVVINYRPIIENKTHSNTTRHPS